MTSVRWGQAVDGIPAFDNGITVHVDDEGRVLAVQGSPLADLPARVGAPSVSAADALRAAMADVDAAGEVRVTEEGQGPQRRTRFADDHEARLVLFGDASGTVLAWRVLLFAAPAEVYDIVVDAADGRILRRANLVKKADEAIVRAGRATASGRWR
jgi:extracellular elastinolytic metalloproteinase